VSVAILNSLASLVVVPTPPSENSIFKFEETASIGVPGPTPLAKHVAVIISILIKTINTFFIILPPSFAKIKKKKSKHHLPYFLKEKHILLPKQDSTFILYMPRFKKIIY
jgi:hypothetical protein